MVDKPIIRIAVENVLFVTLQRITNYKLSPKQIDDLSKRLADEIQKKIIDFHMILENVDKSKSNINLATVLGTTERVCFAQFAALKKMNPEELLRQCIMHYCPIDEMIEQIHSDEVTPDV